ncbi:MAG: hypothetical protein GY953_19735 [bacterium]|nr:hypothetical protein [bacterium]
MNGLVARGKLECKELNVDGGALVVTSDKIRTTSTVDIPKGIRQEKWRSATFVADWKDNDKATYGSASYFKDTLGIVHLRGVVQRVGGLPGVVFVLPAAYRPVKRLPFAVLSAKGSVRVDVLPSGAVFASGGYGDPRGVGPRIPPPKPGWLSLNGISFRVKD